MYPIQCNCNNAASAWQGKTSQAVQVTDTQVASISTSEDLLLNLTTDEGDVVTISLAALEQSDYLYYMEAGQNQDGSYVNQVQSYSSSYEQYISMSVNGDLNEQELQDINTALNTIDEMMTNFVQGRLDSVIADAGELSGLDSISNLNLEMSYTQTTLVARQTEVQTTSVPSDSADDSHGRSRGTHSAGMSDQSATAQPLSELIDEADDLSASMADVLDQARQSAVDVTDALNQIFAQQRDYLENSNPTNALGLSLIDRIQNNLLSGV